MGWSTHHPTGLIHYAPQNSYRGYTLVANVGGHDINGIIVPQRTHADLEAVRIAYETGRLNTGDGGLATGISASVGGDSATGMGFVSGDAGAWSGWGPFSRR